MPFRRALILFAIVLPVCCVARAAELDGVQLPNAVEADGRTLQLNGYGLRTYSVLGIHIYVAALYLQYPSTDPEQILRSPGTKLMVVRFERNISADDARKSWRDGLANNCQAPCQLNPADVAQFLAEIPAMHAGDNYSLLFTSHGATVSVSGQQVGVVSQPEFAEAMLATFLGPRPASPKLKQELLTGHG
jgi:Chalcone isomerase-like